MVPFKVLTRKNKIIKLYDENRKYYLGKSVHKIIANVNNVIIAKIKKMVFNFEKINTVLIKIDDIANKANLGVTVILDVSMVCIKTTVLSKKQPLYKFFSGKNTCIILILYMNILNIYLYINNISRYPEIYNHING